jgi:hypothetical protein
MRCRSLTLGGDVNQVDTGAVAESLAGGTGRAARSSKSLILSNFAGSAHVQDMPKSPDKCARPTPVLVHRLWKAGM